MTTPSTPLESTDFAVSGALGHGAFCHAYSDGRGGWPFLRQHKTIGHPGAFRHRYSTFAAVATLIVIHVTKALTGGIRVDPEEERSGLDNAIHGERGFEIE